MPARLSSSRAYRWSRRCRQQHSLRSGLRHADRQAAGRPTGREQAHGVKTKTKKLPIFITALAGCACGALLVIALIMSGTLDIGGGRNAVTAGASGSSTQKITIDSEDTTLAEPSLPSPALCRFHYRHFERQPKWLAFAVCRRVGWFGQRRFGRCARYRGSHPHQQPCGRWL